MKQINLKDLKPQNPKRYDGDRFLRENVSKGNTGEFYRQLHAIYFGGALTPRYKGSHETLSNGNQYNHSPDIIRIHKFGEDVIEVKSSSLRDHRPMFSYEQLRNNYYSFLKRLLIEKDKAPDFETAIYLFGKEHQHPFLFGYSTPGLVRKLAGFTSVGIVLPSNLTYALTLTLKERKLDKSASKSQTVCVLSNRPHAKTITDLISSNDPVDLLASKINDYTEPNENLPEILRIGDTRYKDVSSEDLADIRVRISDGKKEHRHHITPFRIRKFYLPNKKNQEWLTTLKRDHHHLLEDILGIQDLYFEEHEAGDDYVSPFLVEEKSPEPVDELDMFVTESATPF